MKTAIGILLAAITVFAWEAISWTVLTWHESGYRPFRDEIAMREIFAPQMQNQQSQVTSGAGIYMLPFPPRQNNEFKQYVAHSDVQNFESQSGAQAEKDRLAQYEKERNEGPYIYAIVRPGKRDISMANNLILSFVRSLVCATIIGIMLSLTMLHYPARIAFVAAAGVFAGLVGDMPMWIWFENPGRDTLINIIDHFITWVLAGAVMGFFVGKDVVLTKGMQA
jgi:hypothetical protein